MKGDTLYYEGGQQCEDVELLAIPYYAWGNRGINQMYVWMHESDAKLCYDCLSL